jgi:hypothetical protein
MCICFAPHTQNFVGITFVFTVLCVLQSYISSKRHIENVYRIVVRTLERNDHMGNLVVDGKIKLSLKQAEKMYFGFMWLRLA